MATRKSKSSGAGKSFGLFLFGFVFAVLLLIAGTWGYLRFGSLPVAVADKPFPFEAQIVKVPLHARVDSQMQQAPFGISEDVYEAGAQAYKQQCAACHGTPGHDVDYAKYMYPRAPQLWKKHGKRNIVGVSDDPPGEIFWKEKNGIRLTGMPSYEHILSNDQMWDVALLLQNANQQLPDPIVAILNGK
jgi:thiosulfate dehydrogenase